MCTGNTVITAKRLANAKVVGVDFTPELLVQAKEQASLAEVEDIEWKEGNVEDLPFEDESFDVVLSSFGHMFSPHPEVAIKEMLRVTKGDGGRIAFATWPAELANGRLFAAIAKHMSYPSVDNELHPPPPHHHLQFYGESLRSFRNALAIAKSKIFTLSAEQ